MWSSLGGGLGPEVGAERRPVVVEQPAEGIRVRKLEIFGGSSRRSAAIPGQRFRATSAPVHACCSTGRCGNGSPAATLLTPGIAAHRGAVKGQEILPTRSAR